MPMFVLQSLSRLATHFFSLVFYFEEPVVRLEGFDVGSASRMTSIHAHSANLFPRAPGSRFPARTVAGAARVGVLA